MAWLRMNCQLVPQLLLLLLVLALTDTNSDDFFPGWGLGWGPRGVQGASPEKDSESPLVRNTTYGQVRGRLRSLHYLAGRQVERYLGVPYARPPVGELRFEIPKPPKPWKGVRDAGSLPKACPQAEWETAYVQDHVPTFAKDHMDEDCLYLNLYVPAGKPDRAEEEKKEGEKGGGRPVLIHVHGGSNQVGMGAMFDGDVLAVLADAIVVTFNYRLAALGFLSGDDPDIGGNYGLYDQTELFRWVSKNIHHFGGDPSKVTIQGHSAGGGDVGVHVLSPLSKGLFRYAVMMSGSPLAYWSMMKQQAGVSASPSRRFADSVGCPPQANALPCLKRTTWQKIMDTQYDDGRLEFQPVVDGRLIPMAPEHALKQLTLNGEAFMTGVTSDEGSLLATNFQYDINEKGLKVKFTLREDFTQNYNLPAFREPRRDVPNFGSLLFHEYKSFQDPDNHTADLISVTHIYGDPTFVAPATKVAKIISARSKKIYFYSFNHVSTLSSGPSWVGVPHGRDMFYLFGCPMSGHPLHSYNDVDRNISRAYINLWSNFIRHGRPSLSWEPHTTIPAYDPTNQSYFILGSKGSDVTIRTAQRLRAKHVAFWNSLLPTLSGKNSGRGSDNNGGSAVPSLTWLFVALTTALVVVVVVLAVCVMYYKNQARHGCLHLDPSKEKGACQV